MSGTNPPSDMQEWMRSQAKELAFEKRKASPFPRLGVAEADIVALEAADVALDLRLDTIELNYLRAVIPSSVVLGSGSSSTGTDGTVTFTAASSVSLMTVFDGLGSDKYKVYVDLTAVGGAATTAFLRLRTAAGSDAITAYDYAYYFKTDWSTTNTSNGATGATFFGQVIPTAVATGSFVLAESEHMLTRPGKASPTTLRGGTMSRSSAMHGWNEWATHTTATAYTSLSLVSAGASATLTGSIRVVKIA